ncbi:MAG: HIT domain-containing protein [Candidatus Eisenbacteria bacterium]|nr:HIT domain-containing protein [Candidatus Eisenbacteria bacterium]
MRYLTTPWRMKYVISTAHYKGCVFCDLLAEEASDAEGFILRRGTHGFLVLNIYPYTPGHLMAVPYRHVASIAELEAHEVTELLTFCQLGEGALRRVYGCRSVHGGANLGRVAGAGVPGHLHFHVVAWPAGQLWQRWATAEEPPETLEETYASLTAALSEIEAEA